MLLQTANCDEIPTGLNWSPRNLVPPSQNATFLSSYGPPKLHFGPNYLFTGASIHDKRH